MARKSISVDTSDIPNPPQLSFTGGIEAVKQLNAMWDDPAHWLGVAPFAIQGCPVPLVHWKALYGRQGQAAWVHVKTKWNQWKVGASPATVPERPDPETDRRSRSTRPVGDPYP